MFDEEAPKKKSAEFPRPLATLSIEELREYIGELQEEIRRVEQDIARKKTAGDAANAFFKQ